VEPGFQQTLDRGNVVDVFELSEFFLTSCEVFDPGKLRFELLSTMRALMHGDHFDFLGMPRAARVFECAFSIKPVTFVRGCFLISFDN